MTRREALGKLLAAPRDHADQGRIGRRFCCDKRTGAAWDKPDGREKINYVFRVLKSALRMVA